ncbi:hypothetical protein D9611_012188 [Ephemerocybe angulata]|uniref:GST N-terminal domain-containing protein n=1 Tax=Ephemerocybe angulata TaxID=980116 RepID=A0A8H5FGF7_9AGAR|nr:hypothetical protein D9611_012188 [Tulosesus angulatus]
MFIEPPYPLVYLTRLHSILHGLGVSVVPILANRLLLNMWRTEDPGVRKTVSSILFDPPRPEEDSEDDDEGFGDRPIEMDSALPLRDTRRLCPWAHRTELALKESGLPYKAAKPYEIELTNKPKWYTPKVNPASKRTAAPMSTPQNQTRRVIRPPRVDRGPFRLHKAAAALRAKARFFVESVISK